MIDCYYELLYSAFVCLSGAQGAQRDGGRDRGQGHGEGRCGHRPAPEGPFIMASNYVCILCVANMHVMIWFIICMHVTSSPTHYRSAPEGLRRGDDTVGNPHRAQFDKLELFELITLFNLDKHFSIEQFEPTVSQSTASLTQGEPLV